MRRGPENGVRMKDEKGYGVKRVRRGVWFGGLGLLGVCDRVRGVKRSGVG